MIDVSIFMPAIRTNNWDKMWDSLSLSCARHNWELVLCSPFELTPYLKSKSNVKMIQDYGCPSRCAQLCFFECEGDLVYHSVDDAFFLPDRIDEGVEQFAKQNNDKAIINMRYMEGQNYSGKTMRPDYWMAWGHDGLRLPGIPRHYRIAPHHLMKASYFQELGGYDCSFVYQNFNLHDLIFRAQHNGAIVIDSIRDATTCDHSQRDHKVIEEVHNDYDAPLFAYIYNNPNALAEREKIDINNWATCSSMWKRFSKGLPKGYEELLDK
jgi:hypothetical protein